MRGFWVFLVLSFTPVFAQLTLTPSTDAQALANALAGPGVTVVPGSATLSRPNISGNTGFFSGGTVPSGPGPVLGIPSGVYLATGNTGVLQGPNDRKNYSSGGFSRPDSDLATIAGSNSLFDTVILTFEVIPQGRSLVVDYVFGSEEYPEYV
ncbi:choice-of-anchor L domain-containing protein, partial [Thermus tengchongensis]|uniref:choice-of-anchor L domain-containing protein n=1 Tax=Thermus tengchongensis TaxID=1214928 RepID=UPI00198257A3